MEEKLPAIVDVEEKVDEILSLAIAEGQWGERLDCAIKDHQEALAIREGKEREKAQVVALQAAEAVVKEMENTAAMVDLFQKVGPWAQAKALWDMQPRWEILVQLDVVEDADFYRWAVEGIHVSSAGMADHLIRAYRRWVINDHEGKRYKWVDAIPVEDRLVIPWAAVHQLNENNFQNLDRYVCTIPGCLGVAYGPEAAGEGCPIRGCGAQMVREWDHLYTALMDGALPWESRPKGHLQAVKDAQETTPAEAKDKEQKYISTGRAYPPPETDSYVLVGEIVYVHVPPQQLEHACTRCGLPQPYHNPPECQNCGGTLQIAPGVEVEVPALRVMQPDNERVHDLIVKMEQASGIRLRRRK